MAEDLASQIGELLRKISPMLMPYTAAQARGLTNDDIAVLLGKLRGRIPSAATKISPARNVPNTTSLSNLLRQLEAPIAALETSGLMSLPFTASLLKKDEVRNASVLAWLLDQRSRHGLSDGVLVKVLQHVARVHSDFPTRPTRSCRVNTESMPDGTTESRVDIQVDDPNFYLIIEVKIAAGEQPDQLARYCSIANARAGSRPWAVIFLAPENRVPLTGGPWQDKIVSLTWGQVSGILLATSSDAPQGSIARYLARSFSSHIQKTIGRSKWQKPKV